MTWNNLLVLWFLWEVKPLTTSPWLCTVKTLKSLVPLQKWSTLLRTDTNSPECWTRLVSTSLLGKNWLPLLMQKSLLKRLPTQCWSVHRTSCPVLPWTPFTLRLIWLPTCRRLWMFLQTTQLLSPSTLRTPKKSRWTLSPRTVKWSCMLFPNTSKMPVFTPVMLLLSFLLKTWIQKLSAELLKLLLRSERPWTSLVLTTFNSLLRTMTLRSSNVTCVHLVLSHSFPRLSEPTWSKWLRRPSWTFQ